MTRTRRPTGPLVAALLALAASGCGADEEPVAQTEGTAPTTEKADRAAAPQTATATPQTTTGSTAGSSTVKAPATTAQDTATTTAAPSGGGGSGGGGAGGDGGGAGGGSDGVGGSGRDYDPSRPDSEKNDKPPPPGSPAEKFEKQCERNPESCG
jgi:hypothetical protein